VLYLAPASTGGVELPASFVQVGVLPSGPHAKVAVCPQPSARYALPGNVVTVMESAGQLYSADIRSLTVPAFPTVHADARAADITTKPRTVITSPCVGSFGSLPDSCLVLHLLGLAFGACTAATFAWSSS
jgi:hypothetical protein